MIARDLFNSMLRFFSLTDVGIDDSRKCYYLKEGYKLYVNGVSVDLLIINYNVLFTYSENTALPIGCDLDTKIGSIFKIFKVEEVFHYDGNNIVPIA